MTTAENLAFVKAATNSIVLQADVGMATDAIDGKTIDTHEGPEVIANEPDKSGAERGEMDANGEGRRLLSEKERELWSVEYEERKRGRGKSAGDWEFTVEICEDDKKVGPVMSVVLWEGTRTPGPPAKYFSQVRAICEDLAFLLNGPKYFEMVYDAGSFSDAVLLWMQTEFEPAVNFCARHELLTANLSYSDGRFSVCINKDDDPSSDNEEHHRRRRPRRQLSNHNDSDSDTDNQPRRTKHNPSDDENEAGYD
jgi:hypothetical protein